MTVRSSFLTSDPAKKRSPELEKKWAAHQAYWDKHSPSDEEIARMAAADPDVAPVLTQEERAAKRVTIRPPRALKAK